MVAALLALALALPSAPAHPHEPQWRVHVTASGTYTVDYGAERDLIDGRGDGGWRWEMEALASGYAIDTDLTRFRMSARESSGIALSDGEPYCRPPATAEVGWVRDDRVGLYYDGGRRGFQVVHPFGALL